VSTWAQMAHETLELNANKHGATRRAALFAAFVYALLEMADAVRKETPE
jgi:hypothetical protein